MTTIAQNDQPAISELLAGALAADVELLLFAARRSPSDRRPVDERPPLDECHELLLELAGLSDRLHLTAYDVAVDAELAVRYNVRAVPTVIVRRWRADRQEGIESDANVRFVGTPAGYEFSTLLATIVEVSTAATALGAATRDAVRTVRDPVHLQVFVTPGCPRCPPAARIAHRFAIENRQIQADVIDAHEFDVLRMRYGVQTVPKTVVNDRLSFVGALPEARVLEAVKEALRRAG